MTIVSDAQSPKDFAEAWDTSHITEKPASNVRHKDIKDYVSRLASLGVGTKEVGRSFGNREIFQLEWGKGEIRIFMWSQMHGDEPTATSAMIDMFAFLESNRGRKGWVDRLEETVTIRAVPMLNPDGAELFQRRNLQYIDINRDARRLETPEGQLLKRLRDEWNPDMGFNLHNQQELTSVGDTFNQATNSFLVVSGSEDGESYPAFERNKRIASVMIDALNQFIRGNIGRYDDGYNPRAFGDMISAWGTPVILVETGGYHGKDESFLVRLNFIAYLSALQSLVDGTQESADPDVYDNLPLNSSDRLFNYVLREASIVNFAESELPFVADIAINRERRRADTTPPVFVQEIGDLKGYKGLEDIDVSNYYVVSKSGLLRIGSQGRLLFYKRHRAINWKTADLTAVFAPDAEFEDGKWTKPLPS